MPFTTTVRNSLVNHLLKGTAMAQPGNIYVSLFNGNPEAGGTELSGGGYGRVLNNAWAAASNGQSSNSGEVAFPTATGNWQQATYFGLHDATTGGTRLGSGALTQPRTVAAGDPARFPAGALIVRIT